MFSVPVWRQQQESAQQERAWGSMVVEFVVALGQLLVRLLRVQLAQVPESKQERCPKRQLMQVLFRLQQWNQ